MEEPLDEAVRGYLAAIVPEHRPLFDRLYVGVWNHGVSRYGWQNGHDARFATCRAM